MILRLRLTGCFCLLAGLSLSGCTNDSAPPETEPGDPGNPTSEQTTTPPPSKIRFDDITESAGITFTAVNGRESGLLAIIESLGTGVGMVDIDGDGQLDIILPGGGRFDEQLQPIGCACGVFRQTMPLKFADVASLVGIDTASAYTHGVVAADWNNDGFDDLVLSGFHSVRMYENAGDGTFIDVTAASGVAQNQWATSTAFLDADNDGDLELYVVNYVDWDPKANRECTVGGHRDICPPSAFEPLFDTFYDNNGDGTFTDRREAAGFDVAGKGLAVIAGDIDLDGDTDVYVANDTTANLLYVNDGTGAFKEQGLISGCALGATAQAEGSMGVDLADFDRDGLPDIWVSNFENQSFAMYQSRGPAIFQHVSTVTGISAVGQLYVGFGTVAFDAELDGDIDIFAANGHVMYASLKAPVRQYPLIYENLNGKRFRNVAQQTGSYGKSVHMGRGVAVGDLDRDGLPDLVVAHTNEPVTVLHNTSQPVGKPVSVRLIGRSSNRSSLGVHMRLGDRGDLMLRRSGGSYLSSSDPRVFGAVKSGEKGVTKVEISWPSGRKTNETLSIRSEAVIIEANL